VICYKHSEAEGGTDENALIRAQVIKQIAQQKVGYSINRAPSLGAIVSAARIPAVGSLDMNLPGDVAVPHPAPRYDGNWIRIVVDTFEVSAHLYAKRGLSIRQGLRESGETMGCILTLELNKLAQARFPTLGVP